MGFWGFGVLGENSLTMAVNCAVADGNLINQMEKKFVPTADLSGKFRSKKDLYGVLYYDSKSVHPVNLQCSSSTHANKLSCPFHKTNIQ